MHGESPLPDAEVRFAEDAADVSPHISAAAEPLGHFGPFTFTNSMLMMFITMAVLLIMGLAGGTADPPGIRKRRWCPRAFRTWPRR